MRTMSPGVRAAMLLGGGAAFSPLSVPTVIIWLSASDLSTLKQERTGASATTPSVVDGVVGSWLDKASGVWFVAPSDAARPILRNSGDLYWLEFDGVDDCLFATFTCNQPFDRVIAFRPITFTDNDTFWDGTASNAGRIYQKGLSPNLRAFAGSSEIDLDNEPADDADAVITERWDGAGSRWAFDNSSYTTGNPGTAAAGGLAIGIFGNLADAASNIRVSDVVVGSAFSDANIALLRTHSASTQGRVL